METKRLFDFLYHQREKFPQERAFGGKIGEEWRYFSTQELIDWSDRAARGLLQLGVQPGDRVASVIYRNRPDWLILDLALLKIGAINVPVYPTISVEEYEYIFNDAGVVFCFAGMGDLYDKVNKARENVPSLREIYTFDRHPDRPYWEDMFSDEGQAEVERRMAAIGEHDLATIIYTSGTTGRPKGVMLSHHNIVTNCQGVSPVFPIHTGDKVLSFLPLCHIFERTAAYAYMCNGFNVVFTGTDNLGGETGDLKAIQPSFFTTVPRLLEKVYDRIYTTGLSLTGVKRSLFFWALSLTDEYHYDYKPGGLKAVQWAIADRLIFSKWREALGGNVRGIVTGAAPCPEKILRVFSAAGIPVREAYGLTESAPGLTANRFTPGDAQIGSAGYTLPGISIRLDTAGEYREGEGEILATGPNIMMGYYNKPEETAAVIHEEDGQRWLRTGDVGTLTPGPGGHTFLHITDRKKELLKTSGGKYVAPAPIESKLKEDFLIEHVMVVGDQRKFVSALIVPAGPSLLEWCQRHGMECKNLEEAVREPKVQEKFQHILDENNPRFGHIEQVKRFRLLPVQWEPTTTDGSLAELTPTLKLKRRVILEKYKSEIESMYAE